MMEKVDINNNGLVDFSEFMVANLEKENAVQVEKLKIAFEMFDIDGNGIITLDEIKEVLGTACDVDERVWKEIVREVDDNGDGVIEFKEFQ